MNISEIMERKSPAYYQPEEIVYAVEQYIYELKNRKVVINLKKNIDRMDDTMKFFHMSNQYNLLLKAFNKAQEHYFNKKRETKNGSN